MASRPMAGRDTSYMWKAWQGQKVRQLRAERGLTQDQLAELVGGITNRMISKIEGGGQFVPPERVEAFADAFKLSRDDFQLMMMEDANPYSFVNLGHVLPPEKAALLGQTQDRLGGASPFVKGRKGRAHK